MLSPAADADIARNGPALQDVRQALARLPLTEDAAVLRAQALDDLRRFFAPAAIAFLESDSPGTCQVVSAWNLPAGANRPWPSEACLAPDGDCVLPVTTFGPPVAGVLQEAGLDVAWRVGLDDEEQVIGAVLLFYREVADGASAESFGLAQLYMQ